MERVASEISWLSLFLLIGVINQCTDSNAIVKSLNGIKHEITQIECKGK